MASGTISLSSGKAWEGYVEWESWGNEVDVAVHTYKTDGQETSSDSGMFFGNITVGDNSDTFSYNSETTSATEQYNNTFTVTGNSCNISVSISGPKDTTLEGCTLSGSGTATLDAESGGGSASGAIEIFIEAGEGTTLVVDSTSGEELHHGDTINVNTRITIAAEALDGYELTYYTESDGSQVGFKTVNLVKDQYGAYCVDDASLGYVEITTAATVSGGEDSGGDDSGNTDLETKKIKYTLQCYIDNGTKWNLYNISINNGIISLDPVDNA